MMAYYIISLKQVVLLLHSIIFWTVTVGRLFHTEDVFMGYTE